MSNMTSFLGVQQFVSKNGYFSVYKTKCINKIGYVTDTETNEARYGSNLVIFYMQWGFIYTVRQSRIKWSLSRGYFGSWDLH